MEGIVSQYSNGQNITIEIPDDLVSPLSTPLNEHIHDFRLVDPDDSTKIYCKCGELKEKHAGGRPCEFCKDKEAYLVQTNAYIEKCKNNINGKTIIPFIEELALELNTTDTNLVNWSNKKKADGELEHPEFFAAFSLVKMIQKLRLQQRALGRYQSNGALSLLRFNHGMIETSKQIHSGDANERLEIVIVES